MRAWVDLELPSGERVALGHGALIGRLWSADLPIQDARLSEAHAMVSLRGRDVHLLGLRGRFAIDGRVVSDTVLRPGLEIVLAKGLSLHVAAVHVPDTLFAVRAPGVAEQVLVGVSSLYGGVRPRVVAAWEADADDWIWPTGDGWLRGSTHPAAVQPGDAWEVGGVVFQAVAQHIQGSVATVAEPGLATPITVHARWDTVHIARAGQAVVVISGHMARVISELVTVGAPLEWMTLARMLWEDDDRDQLRRRWDMHLHRLRAKLRLHDLRQDLLRADGSGLVEVVLGPGDVVVDET